MLKDPRGSFCYDEGMKVIAKALLYSNTGEVLILRRSSTHPNFAHHIDFPGGEVEAEEDSGSAVVREITEETGLIINVSALEHVYSKCPDSNTKHLVYTAQLIQANPILVLSWEHESYEWSTLAELLDQPIPAGVDSYYETVLAYLDDTASDDQDS